MIYKLLIGVLLTVARSSNNHLLSLVLTVVLERFYATMSALQFSRDPPMPFF